MEFRAEVVNRHVRMHALTEADLQLRANVGLYTAITIPITISITSSVTLPITKHTLTEAELQLRANVGPAEGSRRLLPARIRMMVPP